MASFATFCNDIKSLSKPLNAIGIDYLSYTRVYKDGSRFALSTEPQALEKYEKTNAACGNEGSLGLYYSNQVLVWNTLPNQKIYHEAKSFGANHGIYLFDEVTDEYYDSFGFATSIDNPSIIYNYFNHLEFLRAFVKHFKQEAHSILLKAEAQKIVLPFANDLKNFRDSHQEQLSVLNLKNATLSPRQSQCAQLLIKGFSYKQIAAQLCLSPRTIEYYLNSLKDKLQCKNKTELVAQLLRNKAFIG